MGDGLGGKIGDRIAGIVNRAAMDRLDRSAGVFSRIAMSAQEEFFRLTGSELRQTMGPFYAKIAEREGAPPWLTDTTKFLAKGQGQWATLLAGTATGSLLGSGLLSVFTNWLQPVTGELIREHPNAPLGVPDAAQAAIRGLGWGPDLWEDAGQSGVDRDRFTVIKQLASTVLSWDQILQLLNRGWIDGEQARQLLKRAGWDHDHIERLIPLRVTLISMQEAAAMWNRDIINDDEGKAIAAQNGYLHDAWDKFTLLGGEPPDTTSLILAWRRGVITEADVDRALVQGPLRKEWIPVIKQLQYQPLDPQELANAVNQGHMDLAAATAVAAQSGYRPDDFKVIIDNAGIPPGPQEALTWISRGIISEADFRTIFLESRIKNKYIDLYLKGRTVILTMAEIRSLFSKGVMTQAQALDRLMSRGYGAEDAGIILAGAQAAKNQGTKDLSVAQIVRLYTDRLIDRATAADALDAHGYDPSESDQILLIADTDRALKFLNATVSRIHTLLIQRRITLSEATAALDRAKLPAGARDDMLALWQIELDVSTKDLTTAEVISATKIGVFMTGPAHQKLQGQGYSSDDALTKLKIAKLLNPSDTVEALQWPNQ